MTFMPGDIQFLHNHTILHARSAYEDWLEQERKRHLLRLWLAPPGARRVAPGVRRMLRRADARRSGRDHLRGHQVARAARAGVRTCHTAPSATVGRFPPLALVSDKKIGPGTLARITATFALSLRSSR